MFRFVLIFTSSLSNFRKSSNATFLYCIDLTSCRNSSERIDMSGLSIPAASKMSTTSSDEMAVLTMLFITESYRSFPSCLSPSNLHSLAFIAWKKAISSAFFIASSDGFESAYACPNRETSFTNLFFPSGSPKM